jgi:hypothetical protein
VWLAFFNLRKRGCAQANRVTLTKFCRCDNSSSNDFACNLRLAGPVKLLAGSLESFTHRRNHFRFERTGSYEWTNWHRRPPLQAEHTPT